MGDPAAVYIYGGRVISHSGVINGDTREALARTEIGNVVIGGGALEIRGMQWEAIHRSGAVNETIGTFTMGDVVIGGQVTPLPGEGLDQLEALKDLVAPLGLDISLPNARVEAGIVFVDHLTIGLVPN